MFRKHSIGSKQSSQQKKQRTHHNTSNINLNKTHKRRIATALKRSTTPLQHQSHSITNIQSIHHLSSSNTNISSNGPVTQSQAGISIRKLSNQERKHLKKQRKGRVVFVPSYLHAKDLSQRIHTTLLQLHKAGTQFFSWWPRASERQLKKDGYSMLSDLVLRFDESYLLLKFLGYKAVYEHTGIERIRNEHYELQNQLKIRRDRGESITPGLKRDLADTIVGRNTGPEPTPDDLKVQHIQPKQPVVCIVGHVNHGKTTLLDKLRGTYLAQHEDGGITQDLYAYQCDIGSDLKHQWNNDENDQTFSSQHIPSTPPSKDLQPLEHYDDESLLDMYQKVTFLDTPGHASFFDMRENGTLFSDLVVLVVSSVEGVCPQTLESIEYIKSFKLPVVIAMTKTDLPNSDVQGVMRQLQQAGLTSKLYDQPNAFDNLLVDDSQDPEDDEDNNNQRGGRLFARKKAQRRPKIQIAPVIPMSALSGDNIVEFRKSLMKCFMTLKPQADIQAPPVGLVLESFKEEGGRGTVMRILMSSGVIERNDNFISGLFSGRVKDLRVYGDITMNEFTSDPKLSTFPNANPNGVIPGTTAAAAVAEFDDFDIQKHQINTDVKARKIITNQDKSFGVGQRKPKLGMKVDYAVPGVPLEIVGINGLASAGDDIRVTPNAMLARTIAETRRLELEYPEQSRFEIGGLKVTDWVPPPMLFKKDYKNNPDILAPYVDEKSILNPEQDEDALATLSDDEGDNKSNKHKKNAIKIGKSTSKTSFGHRQRGDSDDYDDDDDDHSGEISEDYDDQSDELSEDYSLARDIEDSLGDTHGMSRIAQRHKKQSKEKRVSLERKQQKSRDQSDDADDDDYDSDDSDDSDGSYSGSESEYHSDNDADTKRKKSKEDDKNNTGLATIKKKQFSHNNPDSISTSANWNRVHEIEFEYQRPFVIKGATAGGIKMILDSIGAFNERYPNKKIHVVHAMQGTLTENDLLKASSAVDKDLDPDMNCPVLLYRTKKPSPRVLKKAKIVGIEVFSYSVFDDLLKHLVGTHYYNEMFLDSGNLRQYEAGALFYEPTASSEPVHTDITPHTKRFTGPSHIPRPIAPVNNDIDAEARRKAFQEEIDREYIEWQKQRREAAEKAEAEKEAAVVVDEEATQTKQSGDADITKSDSSSSSSSSNQTPSAEDVAAKLKLALAQMKKDDENALKAKEEAERLAAKEEEERIAAKELEERRLAVEAEKAKAKQEHDLKVLQIQSQLAASKAAFEEKQKQFALEQEKFLAMQKQFEQEQILLSNQSANITPTIDSSSPTDTSAPISDTSNAVSTTVVDSTAENNTSSPDTVTQPEPVTIRPKPIVVQPRTGKFGKLHELADMQQQIEQQTAVLKDNKRLQSMYTAHLWTNTMDEYAAKIEAKDQEIKAKKLQQQPAPTQQSAPKVQQQPAPTQQPAPEVQQQQPAPIQQSAPEVQQQQPAPTQPAQPAQEVTPPQQSPPEVQQQQQQQVKQPLMPRYPVVKPSKFSLSSMASLKDEYEEFKSQQRRRVEQEQLLDGGKSLSSLGKIQLIDDSQPGFYLQQSLEKAAAKLSQPQDIKESINNTEVIKQ